VNAVATWPIPRGRFLGHRYDDGSEVWFDGDDFETRRCFYLDAVWKWRRAMEAGDHPAPPAPEPDLLHFSGAAAFRDGLPAIPPLHVHDAGRWAEDAWLGGWLEEERKGGTT